MEISKEFTPMQELIEEIDRQQTFYIELSKKDKTKKKGVDAILTATTSLKIKAQKLLPKEEQVNKHFYEQGFEIGNDVSFEYYYNNKFKKE